MLFKQNLVVENLASPSGNRGIAEKVCYEAYMKMVDYLRLTQAKNTYNRFTDYHYLNIPVSESTEPIRGLDYIHPVVTPGIDYATAVITKCLMPDGKVNFEFERFDESDQEGAEQATDMVKYFINNKNNAYAVIRDWAQDALMHKNGIVMVMPVRDTITQYKEVTGTKDQLKAFELQAAESGLKTLRQQMRKVDVNLQQAMQESMQPGDEQEEEQESAPGAELEEAISNNTIYRAKYKCTGTQTNIRIKHIAQNYYAAYGPAGAYQAGALENDLALHARDSTPVPGQGVIASQGADRYARVVMLTTAWLRKDVDGDGEEEIVEVCYSGSYILYVKEVDFIPLANMCPKPITGNFFGYSLGERLVPIQEYATSIRRAQLSFAMQASTPRIGVNPEFVDAEEIQRGVSAMFVLDRKFDPTKHVFEFAPLQGNLAYVDSAMASLKEDNMAMIGMTSPNDSLNPEIMKDGNSGFKLQTAMGPNQLIQDEMIKNCAIALQDVIHLVWHTMIQNADDYSIQQLAHVCSEKGGPFLDAQAMANYQFIDRKMINIDLGLGFMSDENRLTRQQLITQAQQQFAQVVMQLDPEMPEMFAKARRPYEDTLRVLGVRHVDAYLITMDEAVKLAQAKSKQPPPAEELVHQSKAALNQATVQEVQAKTAKLAKETQQYDVDNMFDAMAAKKGKLTDVRVD